MKYCSKCASYAQDDSIFCPKCGAELPGEMQVVPAAIPPEEPRRYQYAPGYSSAPAPEPPPERINAGLWMGLNIASTLLCCLILGIIGIVFGALGMSAYNRGDYADAKSKADTSKVLFIVGASIGALFLVIRLLTNFGRLY